MNICIAGAGPAGLLAAAELARSGHNVRVFEKKSRQEAISQYSWFDSIELDILYIAGLPIPRLYKGRFSGDGVKPTVDGAGLYAPAMVLDNLAFTADFSAATNVPGISRWIQVDRSALEKWQIERAEALGAELRFSAQAVSLIGNTTGAIENIDIKGVRVLENGEENEYFADIVIDATGIFSALRTQLAPESISKPFSRENCLYGYRTVRRFKGERGMLSPTTDGRPPFPPFDNCSVSLEGERGGIWVAFLDDDIVDVGCCSGVSIASARAHVMKLVDAYAEITDEELWEGQGVIPVDEPPRALVAGGFAVLGDSASMAHPGSGLGVSSAFLASALLSKTINAAKDASISSLWSYAARWYRGRGAHFAGYRTGAPASASEKSRYMMNKNLMNGEAVTYSTQNLYVTENVMNYTRLAEAARAERPELFADSAKYADTGARKFEHFRNYPESWDADAFRAWLSGC